MTCRSCKHEFCWVCNGDWTLHGNQTGGFYKCNRYDPKKKDPTKGEKAEAKAELDRYLFYYQRFHNHDQSKKIAEKQRANQEKRMAELQTKEKDKTTWMDVQFLRSATEQVFECRRILKFTYVFSYYLKDGPEKTLFEYLQQELEKTTEQLSELSEGPLEKMNRTEVANYTGVTQKFLQNLLDGVSNGLTGDVPPDVFSLPPSSSSSSVSASSPSSSSTNSLTSELTTT